MDTWAKASKMKRCMRVGVNVTKRCNFRCKTCFYLHEEGFFTPTDEPTALIEDQIISAQNRGLDHAVIVGYGEPTLWPDLMRFVKFCKENGMKSSIITNGTAPVKYYESLYANGLDHLHISVHGLGDTLNKIACNATAGDKQKEVLEWLKESKLPWRSNTTLQLENYLEVPETIDYIIDHGAAHIVLLGFLPHYGWFNKVRDVAVHPADLRLKIEPAMDAVIKANRWLTLRYHPMCHLRQDLWKYVTNANFVLLDPFEWCYNDSGTLSDADLKIACKNLGDNVSIKTEPCVSCALQPHCGGWNAVYAAGFNGADLTSVPKSFVPEKSLTEFGYYWYQNPVNTEGRGHFAL